MSNKKKLSQNEKDARREKKEAERRRREIITVFAAVAVLVVAAVAIFVIPELISNDNEGDATSPPLSSDEEATSADGGNKMQAPDFTVYDADGNAVKLSDCFGKPIVLNFWASWCGPCKMEMPEFNAKYLEYKDKVTFLMVDVMGNGETVEKGKGYVEGQGYSFPVFFDTTQTASYTYGVSSIPTTYFIDSDGNIIDGVSGAISGDKLQEKIDKIYK